MAINRFDQYQESEYVPQYVPLPIEEIGRAAAFRQGKHEENLAKNDYLDDLLGTIPSLSQDDPEKKRIINEYRQQMQEYGQSGDYSQAGSYVRRLTQKFKNDLVTGKLGAIKGSYDNYLKDIEAIDKSDIPSYEKQRLKSVRLQEYQGIGEDTGEGFFNQIYRPQAVAGYYDLNKVALEVGSKINPQTIKRDFGWYDTGKGYWTNGTQKSTRLPAEVVMQLVKPYLANDPKALDYLNQAAKLHGVKPEEFMANQVMKAAETAGGILQRNDLEQTTDMKFTPKWMRGEQLLEDLMKNPEYLFDEKTENPLAPKLKFSVDSDGNVISSVDNRDPSKAIVSKIENGKVVASSLEEYNERNGQPGVQFNIEYPQEEIALNETNKKLLTDIVKQYKDYYNEDIDLKKAANIWNASVEKSKTTYSKYNINMPDAAKKQTQQMIRNGSGIGDYVNRKVYIREGGKLREASYEEKQKYFGNEDIRKTATVVGKQQMEGQAPLYNQINFVDNGKVKKVYVSPAQGELDMAAPYIQVSQSALTGQPVDFTAPNGIRYRTDVVPTTGGFDVKVYVYKPDPSTGKISSQKLELSELKSAFEDVMYENYYKPHAVIGYHTDKDQKDEYDNED